MSSRLSREDLAVCNVVRELAVERIEKILDGARGHGVARLVRSRADVQQCDDLRHAQQRRIRGQRLMFEDIEPGTGNRALA